MRALNRTQAVRLFRSTRLWVAVLAVVSASTWWLAPERPEQPQRPWAKGESSAVTSTHESDAGATDLPASHEARLLQVNDTPETEAGAGDNPGAGEIDFSRDILPILSNQCYHCHGPDQDSEEAKEAGFRLDDREDALLMLAIVPGDAEASGVIERVTTSRSSMRMPPIDSNKPQLEPAQVELLRRWIDQGAEYSDHWSFVKPVKPELPEVSDPAWASNGVDAFVHQGLERAGLSPREQETKRRLIRRVTLDLTGLPPTPAEVAAFVNDDSADAYAKAVDRLLASDHFGEHWAQVWLDKARYADSQGFEKDRPRTMWRYREWVINALNADMPFDRFTVEQLAGDLLADPTLDQLIATGFHRNTQTNTEGGTDDEEFRSAAIIDRTNTTMEVWMGLTMGCAQCHTHKFDPIYHEEYYQFYAFFNQSADADRFNDEPFIQAPTVAQSARLAELERKIAEAQQPLTDPQGDLAQVERAWEDALRSGDTGWNVLDPQAFSAKSGATMTELDDHSILVTGENPDKDIYTIEARTDLTGITAVKLEAIADERLPSNGPGRVAHGNFVVNDFALRAEPLAATQRPVARYVRVDLPGNGRILSLAEVQVFSGEDNVAVGTKAVQSTTAFSGSAFFAVDGVTDGDFEESMTTHTATQNDPWWESDLGKDTPVDQIVLWNRTDGNVQGRLSGAVITLMDADRNPLWQASLPMAGKDPAVFETSGAQRIVFDHASATFANADWPVALAVDPMGVAGNGWAIHPTQGQTQAAVFQAGSAVGFEGGTVLRFTVNQDYGQQHTLGRFRILVTTRPRPVRALPNDIRDILAVAHEDRSPAQAKRIAGYFVETAPQAQAIRNQVEALQRELAVLQGRVPTALVMEELPADRHRETYLFGGGSFLAPDKERGIMEPGTPAVFHPFPEDAPNNRLGLAQWLTHDDNPLTARVQVNRIWEQLFGIGLVETTNDFGFQGSYPSDKELLDYLAVMYQHDYDWSAKALIRLIVTSSAYQQSSKVNPILLDIDPYNRLISRGPRLRLSAEQIRDQALFVAGLLKYEDIGGPSVMPYLPAGLLPQAFDSYVQQSSDGDDVYRRGMYTAWRRTGHYPSFATFDAPSREICTIKRSTTNTPLQALVTLNDPVYVEAAQALGRLLMVEAGEDFDARIVLAFERALAREPKPEEIEVLRQVYDAALADYREDLMAAKSMATDPHGPLPEGMDPADTAAMAVVCNVVLNLDEFLNKP